MRYLNKRFFKFVFGFLLVVAVSLTLIAAVNAYAAGIEKISFTTDEQIVAPGEISSPITIQAQDANGNSFQTPETLDLEFVSSSPTGEFLNSAGNPVTNYMSKNTANRTFYYRDSSVGSFVITVKAIGRDSGENWQANQNIVISSSGSFSSKTTNTSSSNTTTILSGSSVSGPASASNSGVSSSLEVVAGPDRLTTPGSPITFQAFIKKNTGNKSVSFSWSFGDGNVDSGDLVSHMYKYPGDYAVVLNAHSGDAFAVSRLKVKVIEPDIEIKEGEGYVEIINRSGAELNLFNWKITNGHYSFIFQPDTIIFPNSSIKIEDSMFRMKSSEDFGLALKNFLGQIVAVGDEPLVAADSYVGLTEIIPESFYLAQTKFKEESQSMIEESPEVDNGEILGAVTDTLDEVGMAGDILYEAPKEKSLIAKIWTFLVNMLP